MSGARRRPRVLAVATLALLALTAGQGVAASAAPGRAADAAAATAGPSDRSAESARSARSAQIVSAEVGRVEDQVARSLAASLTDSGWRAQVRDGVGSESVDLHALTARSATAAARQLGGEVDQADRRIAGAKGLGTDLGPLLRVQLADPSMRGALDTGAEPLVAAAVADDHAATITAYDAAGRAHTLDARRVPDRPVYVVDLDTAKTTAAGMDVLRRELARNGVNAPTAAAGRPAAGQPSAAAAGWWATKINAIEVSDDQEPWFKGAAEMFTLVTGFGQDGKPRVDSVDMPYLDYDGTVYHPNQILVNWSNYKYNLADAVMMEDDGNTNYLALAQAIAAVLLTIADQGAYIPLVSAVLAAMPASWWTDDPDYVESWYTLAKNSTGRLGGAAGKGWMTVEPYFVQQF
ncbi:DUF3103 family protein [Kitasatospora sp. NPDC050543]|uniref:DUF3103 family protein n=1 Tax=Kitasatospora sp. NPDC050543 TaxID=3364054 RepID=UPI0037A7E9B2